MRRATSLCCEPCWFREREVNKKEQCWLLLWRESNGPTLPRRPPPPHQERSSRTASCTPLEVFQIRTGISRWARQHLLKEKASKTGGRDTLFSRPQEKVAKERKGWDTRLCKVCLSNSHTINTDPSCNSRIKSLALCLFFK